MPANLSIRPFKKSDIPLLLPLSHQILGQDFYTEESLLKGYKLSHLAEQNFSFVLVDHNDKPLGLRLTYPPGQWLKHTSYKLNTSQWPVAPENAALFKTIFLDPSVRGQSWARKLSEASIKELKKVNTLAIITYCWKESPNNSSYLYLKKLGFDQINEYPNFWESMDYLCSGCKQENCICTALEMVREI